MNQEPSTLDDKEYWDMIIAIFERDMQALLDYEVHEWALEEMDKHPIGQMELGI